MVWGVHGFGSLGIGYVRFQRGMLFQILRFDFYRSGGEEEKRRRE